MARRGRKPVPRATDHGKGAFGALPRCPAHLSDTARKEWRRLAGPLHATGLLTLADRAALAAYCQAYGRWVEAEEKLRGAPMLLKAPNGYVQQSPWLSVANKQLEIMGRYMSELGLTPVSRTRLANVVGEEVAEPISVIFRTIISPDNRTSKEPLRITRGADQSSRDQ